MVICWVRFDSPISLVFTLRYKTDNKITSFDNYGIHDSHVKELKSNKSPIGFQYETIFKKILCIHVYYFTSMLIHCMFGLHGTLCVRVFRVVF